MVLRAPASCAGHAGNPLDLNGPCHLLCGASLPYPPGRELKRLATPRLAFTVVAVRKDQNNLELSEHPPLMHVRKKLESRFVGQPPST
jgi:hypothetical protein